MKCVPEIETYVRLFEINALGHVSNISYYFYMEEARIKFLEYNEMDGLRNIMEQKLQFLVGSTNCNNYKQAFAK